MTALADIRRRFRLPEPTRREGVARTRPGWLVVADKEFGDHVTSIRFVVLLLILAVAVAAPLYFASQTLRDLAQQASGFPAIFLALFTSSSQDIQIPRFYEFIGLLAPLLGIAFGFDAVNVERTQGTLPRLVSQPIHRDDVINGKFAAGLAVIALILGALTVLVAAVGIVRLGIVPNATEVLRLVAWYLLALVYVGFWLALATLLSVAVRQAAASALISIGIWFFLAILWWLPASIIASVLAPAVTSDAAAVAAQRLPGEILRLSPSTMYSEASFVLLNPVLTPQVRFNQFGVGSLAQYDQLGQQLSYTFFSVDQSIALVLPQIVALIALTVIAFALSYVLFMRQEVRA
jgi:ABC-2 type transport system permease protein